jgi:hypothetical protein
MRINELFDAIKNCPRMGSVSKRDLYKTVRTILDSRNTLGIRNNVADLYEHAARVEEDLASEIEDVDTFLDIILTLPEVQDYLKTKGVLDGDGDEDGDGEEDDDEEDDEEDEDEDDEDEEDEDEDWNKDGDEERIDATNIKLDVNVSIPFSWLLAITTVASIANLCLAIAATNQRA